MDVGCMIKNIPRSVSLLPIPSMKKLKEIDVVSEDTRVVNYSLPYFFFLRPRNHLPFFTFSCSELRVFPLLILLSSSF